ncbi:MAG: NYN domain-containing protein [Gammaproteobacteria bacterium]
MPETTPTFILDGHNILYAARPAFLEHLVDGHPGTAAREALVQRLLLAFASPGPEVCLYFDGSEPMTEARSDRVRVIYSGGDGDQRADRAILRQVSLHAAAGEVAALVVVTRDIKLARRARKRGASVMAPGAFLETLGT